jgi:hypothetical protein
VSTRNVIVLIVDGWGTPWLGPYGNTWIETLALNRLAAESFLCEHAITDTPDLPLVYRSYWRGSHALCPDTIADGFTPIAELLEAAGITTALVTDEPGISGHPLAATFGDRRPVSMSAAEAPAAEFHETQMARLFAAAADCLSQLSEPYFLWIHAQGMLAPWDAPLNYRNQFAGEEDPVPPEFVEVPCRLLPEDYDPDELLGIQHAYAGQIALLDQCLGGLLAYLDEDPLGSDVSLLVTSPRGFPVGEHRRVGFWDNALYGEVTQIPWIMRLPDPLAVAARTQALVQPADLYATILDWYDIPAAATAGGQSLLPLVRGEVSRLHDRACVVAEEEPGIRTRDWYLRHAERDELFAKPDDRWEINEVADRGGEVPQLMVEALQQSAEVALTGKFGELQPISPELDGPFA